ncbi:MAG: YggS family pyridoxal phosphate enzyme [Candidatus Muproteobacteria bacterium RBG_16_64_10]|uniref:Pyridoxal phosphate homeostasis protein n=1 Tax=Candidatus Muproteobacteria bacterium RBG_16_64_10 TaxID=1817757 RepID=A0A1F6T0I5_9PROT|nr:MAG: YggS family pyridoxal phosphate enzyme [Candidatus Muproteobacteria bacterium RBG_16_64_10]
MHDLTATIARNLAQVRAEIAAAARTAGRKPEDVRLIAVSKTHPPEAVAAAIAAGQMDFGENTVQEALTKIPLYNSVTWHMIGHLQSNKAKFVPGNFAWVHSVDSLSLAQRLSRLAQGKGVVLDTLFEVNITRDTAKHGLPPEELAPVLDTLLKEGHPGLRLRGLMTIGPYPATEADSRACFARLRELRDDCRQRFGLKDFTELSMGMSGDYAAAIKEGATMVRIGTAIFGKRDYSRDRPA